MVFPALIYLDMEKVGKGVMWCFLNTDKLYLCCAEVSWTTASVWRLRDSQLGGEPRDCPTGEVRNIPTGMILGFRATY